MKGHDEALSKRGDDGFENLPAHDKACTIDRHNFGESQGQLAKDESRTQTVMCQGGVILYSRLLTAYSGCLRTASAGCRCGSSAGTCRAARATAAARRFLDGRLHNLSGCVENDVDLERRKDVLANVS